MKILWLTGSLTPEAANHLNVPAVLSGGWLIDLSKMLSDFDDIELHIATAVQRLNVTTSFSCNKITYHVCGLPRILSKRSKKGAVDWLNRVIDETSPDVIHFFGTEYEMAELFVNAASEKQKNLVLTIQGLLQRVSEKYDGELTKAELKKALLPIEILKQSTISNKKRVFLKRAEKEKRILQKITHVTGRTFWDKSVMMSCNPNLVYHRLNFNLREPFYFAPKWSIDNCERYTIFTGQATYPLKGLHQLVRALGIVKQKYPNVKLIVPGSNAKNGKLKVINGYTKFLESEIIKNKVEENICFCGGLSAEKVAEQMIKSHVTVVPSAMEGASATMCEAMYLGVPCIGTFRGGITELIEDRNNGYLYDYPEYTYLADRIIELFSDDNIAKEFSQKNITAAEQRHMRDINAQKYHDMYFEIGIQ